jgi:hypothetical protein
MAGSQREAVFACDHGCGAVFAHPSARGWHQKTFRGTCKLLGQMTDQASRQEFGMIGTAAEDWRTSVPDARTVGPAHHPSAAGAAAPAGLEVGA